jgi:cytoskeletal protein CcmA (bactofilin family)
MAGGIQIMFGAKNKEALVKDPEIKENISSTSNDACLGTVIGAGTKITGTISVNGTVRIDGSIEGTIDSSGDVIIGEGGCVQEGKIDSSGDVIIGEGGCVQADINAQNVTLAGTVKGNVQVSGKLEVLSTGKVIGDIRVASLSVSDGGELQGKCEMIRSEPAAVTFDEE